MTNSLPTSATRVRFAPSPTGYLHVGGARTALFNFLFARHTGGKFLLRIEDTDLERSTPESVQQILDAMHWLGLYHDEEIEYQTARAPMHRARVQQLVENGRAYLCHVPKERLDELREDAKREGRAFVYRRSLLPDADHAAFAAAGHAPVVRMLVPEDGMTTYDDLVYGTINVANSVIGDFVIARGDGSPIYNFVNAVDDIEMAITHVIRGEDHVSNTARQIHVYEALGAAVPKFAHLPLILGADRQRLSKRHGATSVMQFQEAGILPQALRNFLALLGWAPDGGEFDEMMSLEELCEKFSLDRVNKSGAVFDHEKLHWMNGMYIRRMPVADVEAEVMPRLQAAYGDAPAQRNTALDADAWTRGVLGLEIERSRTFHDFVPNLEYFYTRPTSYDEKGRAKFLATPEQVSLLREAVAELVNVGGFDGTRETFNAAADAHMRAWADARGQKFGQVIHPIRLALTGRTASPGLFDVAYYLGPDEMRARTELAASLVEPPSA